jgi:hypothetical protein
VNNWDIKEIAIVEADDFQDKYDRNGLNYLFYWKAKYPNFRITLFTIPDKTSQTFKNLIDQCNWIEIAVHGFNHDSNFECYGWDYNKCKTLMEKTQRQWIWKDTPYIKIFKAPGWSITPDNNGYPSAPEDLINKDKQAVYKALTDMDYIIMDRHYNKSSRSDKSKVICVDCNPYIVHMHTWNMMTPDKENRNGFEQIEDRGVPWDNNTKFYTLGEAWLEGLIKPCL